MEAAMYDEALRELEYISQAAGSAVEYTQGGGGNTSAKLDGELMAVKASGFKLKQVNSREGYVVVNYKNIRSFYENIDLAGDADFEKESAEFVKNNVIDAQGPKKLRPSVEAGFHSILKKYVVHTHPVYANIVCCTKNGRETVQKIFRDRDFATAWVPYINPGFYLTLKISEAIRNGIKDNGRFPEVIFLENHGLVVTSDDSRRCIELHREANDAIREYFGISGAFPAIRLSAADDGATVSNTEYLVNFFRGSKITPEYFDEIVLYPDQLVYLNGNISMNGAGGKLDINTDTGRLVYKAGPSEALTIEETLLAYLYVVNEIRRNGLPLKTMSEKEVDFIRNWESEAYRKKLMKSLSE